MKTLSITNVLSVATALILFVPLAAVAAGPAAVNLGMAGNFVILAKTGVSTTGSTSVVGDIGVSPAAATYITGFALTLPAAGAFSTSALVTGKVYASDYANPTPANVTTAVLDMQTAYTDAAGRAPTVTELGAGNIGGLTLAPGVYAWSTGLLLPTNVTLSGGANDVWIFQIAQNLTVSSGVNVTLSGGAQAAHIFWQVAGQTTIGTTAVMNGNILGQTAIILNTGALLNGRALAQTAVTLDSSTVTVTGTGVSATIDPSTYPTTNTTPTQPSANPSSNAPTTNEGSGSSATQASTATQQTTSTRTSGLSPGQIQSILDVIASFGVDASTMAKVKSSLLGTTAASTLIGVTYSFKTSLSVGSKGNDVKALQQFLNSHGYTVAASGPGSPGNETITFGQGTKNALVKFQRAVGITPASGFFGSGTRTYISTHY